MFTLFFLPFNERDSISGTVSGRHESWEFDSGARDLSPEPHSLQKLVEAAAGGTGNMLDLANKVSRNRFIPVDGATVDICTPAVDRACKYACTVPHPPSLSLYLSHR